MLNNFILNFLGEGEQHFENGIFSNNTLTGIILDHSIYHTFKNYELSYNNYGIYLQTSSMMNTFENCVIERNKRGLHTAYFTMNYLRLSFINCDINSNDEYGIFYNSYYNLDNRSFKTKILLQNSTIRFHKNNQAINIFQIYELTIQNNTFIDNRMDIYTRFKSDKYRSTYYVKRNIFSNTMNIYGYRISVNAYSLRVEFNKAFNNKGSFIAAYIYFISFKNNEIMNCSIIQPLINLIFQFRYTLGIYFQNNVLQNNYELYKSSFLSFGLYPYNVLTTIAINGENVYKAHITENVFSNPKISYELVFYSENGKLDCKKNYWGGMNVLTRVIGNQKLKNIGSLDLFPTYSDSQLTMLDNETTNIINNTFIYLDVVDDLVLEKGKYIVRSYIRVARNASLTIESGVTIYFWPYSYVIVYGKLDIIGSKPSDVIFTVTERNPNENLTLNDQNVISYNHLGTIYNVCYTQNYNALSALCLALGYRKNILKRFIKQSNDAGVEIECDNHFFESCKISVQQACNNLIIKCVPIKWDSINIMFMAKPTVIKGLTILNAGIFTYSINIESRRVNMSFVDIHSDNNIQIIKVKLIWFEKEFFFDNINLKTLQGKKSTVFIEHDMYPNRLSREIFESSFFWNDQTMIINSYIPFIFLFISKGESVFFKISHLQYHSAMTIETAVDSFLEVFIFLDYSYKTNLFVQDIKGSRYITFRERYHYYVNDHKVNLTTIGWPDRNHLFIISSQANRCKISYFFFTHNLKSLILFILNKCEENHFSLSETQIFQT